MVAFIDAHRGTYGVEPICAALPIAPSTYYRHRAHASDPTRRPARARRDATLRGEIRRVYDAEHQVYGARKVWRQLAREGVAAPRCAVERLMRALGLRGARRGAAPRTTTPAPAATASPGDLVARDFTAARPNALWVADLTYVATGRGFVYTAFVIDAFARRVVGWRVATSLAGDLPLGALDRLQVKGGAYIGVGPDQNFSYIARIRPKLKSGKSIGTNTSGRMRSAARPSSRIRASDRGTTRSASDSPVTEMP